MLVNAIRLWVVVFDAAAADAAAVNQSVTGPESTVGGLPDRAVDQRQRFALSDLFRVDDDSPAYVLVDDAERAGDRSCTQSDCEIVVSKV